MRWLALGLVLAGCASVPVPFDAEELYRVGRFEPDGRFVWSASRLSLKFKGSGKVRAVFQQTTRPVSAEGPGQPLRLRFDLDGAPEELYANDAGALVFEANVPPGVHRLTVVRQSEALVGEAQFVALELPPGAKLQPWQPQPLFEFIGDSVTVGFGVEGRDPCPFSSRTQAITAAFPWLVGAQLGADVRVVGWSGRGVIRNWADRPEPTVPQQWTPAEPHPKVVFIALGANDWWSGDPGPDFLPAYVAFVDRVKRAYPGAVVFSVTTGPRASVMRQARELELIELSEIAAGGCVGHPDSQAHRRIADEVIARACAGAAAGFCPGASARSPSTPE